MSPGIKVKVNVNSANKIVNYEQTNCSRIIWNNTNAI